MIFLENAPRYWAAGLPVIPLHERDKKPILSRWQQFCDRMPTEEERAEWLLRFPNSNIGLPLGPCSNLMAVDIDSDDPKIIGAIERRLPPTPWWRVGKKGKVLIYRYNGEGTSRIKDENGNTIVEILSRGTQIVLPPSIHPVTGKLYVANVDLTEIFSKGRPP